MGGAAADPAPIFSPRGPHRGGPNSPTPHRLGIVTGTDLRANLCLPGPRISGQAPATDLHSSSQRSRNLGPGLGPRPLKTPPPPTSTPLK